MAEPIKVLLLAADPSESSVGLRIDHEIRRVLESIRMGRAANQLEIATELAVRPGDLVAALLRHRPQVVHFAGHGDGGAGIYLDEGELVLTAELAALFTTFSEVRLVVLNACETLPLGKALSEVVDYTVAMEMPIGDDAANEFSGAFYAALAFGRGVPFAFELARNIVAARVGEHSGQPHLLVRPGAVGWPPEAAPAPESALSLVRRIVQRIELDDVEASSAELAHKAARMDGIPADQTIAARRMKVDGPLTVKQHLT